MSDDAKRRSPSRDRAGDKHGFVTVKRHGGWKTDIPAVVQSPAYQRQLDAVKDLSKKGLFDKESA